MIEIPQEPFQTLPDLSAALRSVTSEEAEAAHNRWVSRRFVEDGIDPELAHSKYGPILELVRQTVETLATEEPGLTSDGIAIGLTVGVQIIGSLVEIAEARAASSTLPRISLQ